MLEKKKSGSARALDTLEWWRIRWNKGKRKRICVECELWNFPNWKDVLKPPSQFLGGIINCLKWSACVSNISIYFNLILMRGGSEIEVHINRHENVCSS